MKNIKFKYLIAIVILTTFVIVVSIILFPSWCKSLGSIVLLVVTAIVGSVIFVAGVRQAIEKDLFSQIEELISSIKREEFVKPSGYLSQLPPVPSDFIGRDKERNILKTAIISEGCEIIGIFGMGGIGKTTLAYLLGHELKEIYPDGQIVLEMRGLTQYPLNPDEALKQVLYAHDPSIIVPESSGQLQSMFTSILTERKELIILDDVSEDTQVERLIPPTGNLLILTSRRHLVLPGIRHIKLGSLSREDAKQLIISIAPHTKGVEDKIAKACSDHPYAIRILASALAVNPNLTPKSLLRQLKLGRKKLNVINATLELSFQLLPYILRSVWTTLAVFPGDFDDFSASAVTGLSKSSMDDALSMFVRMSILEFDSDSNRYKLHDLLREHASSKLVGSERRLLILRFSNHYFKFVSEMNDLFHLGGNHALEALQQIDTEWHNIIATRRFYVSLGKDVPEAAPMGAAFHGIFVDILDVRLSTEEKIEWIKDCLTCAKISGQEELIHNNLGYLGNALIDNGDDQHAIAIHKEALSLAKKLGAPGKIGISLAGLGNAYLLSDEINASLYYLLNAFKLTKSIRDRRGEGHCSRNLASVYLALGELDKAEMMLKIGLSIAEEFKDLVGKSYTLNSIGLVHLERGDEKTALEFFEHALELKIQVGDRGGQINTMINIAQILGAKGKEDQAFTILRTAKELAVNTSAHTLNKIEELEKKIEEE